MDDVEFRVAPVPDDDPPEAEDVVDVDPRPVPRWLIAFGTAAALALAVAVLAVRGGTHAPLPVVLPTSFPSIAETMPVSPIGPTVANDSDEIALDVALAGNLLYTLRYDQLTTTDAYRGTVLGRVHVGGLEQFQGGPTMRLFLDRDSFTAWVLTENVFPHRILEFNSSSLSQRRAVVAPSPVYGAATLDGRLYLATSDGFEVLTPHVGAPTLLARTAVPIEAMAADPARGRVLAVDSGVPQHILAITPDGTVTAVATTRLVEPVLAVAGDRIWVAGYSASGAMVTRLDPTTLLPMLGSPVAGQAGPGAQLTAGEHVVWVSSGFGEPQRMWCLNADTGAVAGFWPGLPGIVSSRDGLLYAVRGGQVVMLPRTRQCPG